MTLAKEAPISIRAASSKVNSGYTSTSRGSLVKVADDPPGWLDLLPPVMEYPEFGNDLAGDVFRVAPARVVG